MAFMVQYGMSNEEFQGLVIFVDFLVFKLCHFQNPLFFRHSEQVEDTSGTSDESNEEHRDSKHGPAGGSDSSATANPPAHTTEVGWAQSDLEDNYDFSEGTEVCPTTLPCYDEVSALTANSPAALLLRFSFELLCFYVSPALLQFPPSKCQNINHIKSM